MTKERNAVSKKKCFAHFLELFYSGGYLGQCPNLHGLGLTQKSRHQLSHLVYCLNHLHQQVWFQMSSSKAIRVEKTPAWLLSHLSRACLHSFVCTALRNLSMLPYMRHRIILNSKMQKFFGAKSEDLSNIEMLFWIKF